MHRGPVPDSGNSMRQFKRSQRLGQQIHRDISALLERGLSDFGPGIVTFTRVKLSDDLRHARVYYSYLGSAEDRDRVTGYLLRERKRIRHQVGQKLRVRVIPEIDFTFDPSIEEGIKIERILEELKSKSEQ